MRCFFCHAVASDSASTLLQYVWIRLSTQAGCSLRYCHGVGEEKMAASAQQSALSPGSDTRSRMNVTGMRVRARVGILHALLEVRVANESVCPAVVLF